MRRMQRAICWGWVALFLLLGTTLGAVEIVNETGGDLSVRAYYCRESGGKMTGTAAAKRVALKAGASVVIERPDRKWQYDRELYFSPTAAELTDTLDDKACRRIAHCNIGTTQGNSFYLASDKGVLKGYNTAEWKVAKPLLEKANKALAETKDAVNDLKEQIKNISGPLLKEIRAEMTDHPYAKKVATVRQSTQLCAQETEFVGKRRTVAQGALEKALGTKLKNSAVPVIGVAVSGGGYRAMIGCVGLIMGLQGAGRFDGVTYLSTCSGSTWAVAPWMAEGTAIGDFRENLLPRVRENLTLPVPEKATMRQIGLHLLAKKIQGQSVTIVDLWGALVARKLLNAPDGHFLKPGLSLLAGKLSRGTVPMPIFTAVCNNICPDSHYEWFEFTPLEMGSTYLQAFVPIWAYGRPFKNGTSTDFAREQSMAYGLGIFGSAFSIRVGDILDRIPLGDSFNDKAVQDIFRTLLASFRTEVEAIRKQALLPAGNIHNFARDLVKTPASAKTKELIKLSDAGHHANNPLPPLLRRERGLDIILVFDFSGGSMVGAPQLKPFVEYCRRHGLVFPVGDWTRAGVDNITIFGDPNDLKSPVIVYIPRIRNPNLAPPFNTFDPQQTLGGYLGTMNLSYSSAEVKQWSDYVRLNVAELAPKILEVIRARAKARGGK